MTPFPYPPSDYGGMPIPSNPLADFLAKMEEDKKKRDRERYQRKVAEIAAMEHPDAPAQSGGGTGAPKWVQNLDPNMFEGKTRDIIQNAQNGPGNINLHNRPVVQNGDDVSTVRSKSWNIDGREVLLPTVSDDGRLLSDKEALDQYYRTGRHLGIFDSPEAADAYARRLHNEQAAEYLPKRSMTLPTPGREQLLSDQLAAQRPVPMDPSIRARYNATHSPIQNDRTPERASRVSAPEISPSPNPSLPDRAPDLPPPLDPSLGAEPRREMPEPVAKETVTTTTIIPRPTRGMRYPDEVEQRLTDVHDRSQPYNSRRALEWSGDNPVQQERDLSHMVQQERDLSHMVPPKARAEIKTLAAGPSHPGFMPTIAGVFHKSTGDEFLARLRGWMMGASQGRTADESLRLAGLGAYKAGLQWREDRKEQMSLEQARQVAIDLGMPPKIAANANKDLLASFSKTKLIEDIKRSAKETVGSIPGTDIKFDSEMGREYQAYRNLGYPHERALAIASNAITTAISSTGVPVSVNKLSGEQELIKLPKEMKVQKFGVNAKSDKSLYEQAEYGTGVYNILADMAGRVLPQIPLLDQFEAPKQRAALTSLNINNRQLVTALMQSPRFAQTERTKLEAELALNPSMFMSPQAWRTSARQMDKTLRIWHDNLADDAENPSFTTEERSHSAKAASAIEQYLQMLNAPQEADDSSQLEGDAIVDEWLKNHGQ